MTDLQSDYDRQLALQAYAGLDSTLDEAESSIDRIAGLICCWIESQLQSQDKALGKVRTKITRSINRTHGQMADGIDHIWMQVRSWLDSQQQQHEWELTQLGVRARLLEIGQSADDIVPSLQAGKPPVPEYVGRLCLWIDQDTPGFASLLTVLREIRDRLPAMPVEFVGEKPAGESDVVVSQPADSLALAATYDYPTLEVSSVS